MDYDIIEYRPNMGAGIIALFSMILEIAYIFFVSLSIISENIEALELFVLGIIALVLLLMGKNIYDSSKTMIIFEIDGLRLINDGNVRHCYVSYKNFSYGYYSHYRGDLMLILSSKYMNQKEIESLLRKWWRLRRWSLRNVSIMQKENTVVIPINEYDKKVVVRIRDLIVKKIPLVEDFWQP